MAKWTTDGLERALRKRIREHPISIAPDRLKSEAANVHWSGNGERARIRVDPMQVSWLRAVVHELIHLELSAALEPFGELEETIVVALEGLICDRIEASNARFKWWRAAIEDKVGSGYWKK